MSSIDFAKLAEPFPAADIEWRVQSAGKKDGTAWARVLAYITNRAIMDRLDAVVGPGLWRNEFRYEGKAVLCGLSILTDAGEWITKWDGAENTDIEAIKGGLSSAMKRAAVQWGIGRYLYNLEEGRASVTPNGVYYQGAKSGDKGYPAFKWNPPALPAWALPGGSGKPSEAPVAARHELPAKPVATKGPEDLYLPGTKAHLSGHGGKRIGDVDSKSLATILAYLREKDEKKYVDQINAIEMVLDDRAQAGGSPYA